MKTKILKVLLGLLLAAIVPTILVSIINESLIFDFLVFIVAFGHALIVGLPVFLLCLRLHLVRWWSSLTAGFIVGAVPLGISEFSSVIAEGEVVSTVGLLEYFSKIGLLGVLGASGGLAFWFVWRGADNRVVVR